MASIGDVARMATDLSLIHIFAVAPGRIIPSFFSPNQPRELLGASRSWPTTPPGSSSDPLSICRSSSTPRSHSSMWFQLRVVGGAAVEITMNSQLRRSICHPEPSASTLVFRSDGQPRSPCCYVESASCIDAFWVAGSMAFFLVRRASGVFSPPRGFASDTGGIRPYTSPVEVGERQLRKVRLLDRRFRHHLLGRYRQPHLGAPPAAPSCVG